MTCALIDRSDDLFELVWRGAAGGGMEGQPSCCNPTLSSRAVVAVVPVPERLVPPPPAPPSEAEMASWLFPIVSGGDAVVAGQRAWVDDDQMVTSSGKESSDHKLQVRGDD